MFASKDTLLTRPSGGYTIARSVRLRSSATGYLSRTPASTTNRKTWTWSGWMKRGTDKYSLLFAAGNTTDIWNTGTNCTLIGYWLSTNQLAVYNNGTVFRNTAQVFRDPSAWYHIVVAFDTTQATAANRLRVYINGAEVTSWDTNNAPTQNLDMAVNVNQNHFVGGQSTNVANAYFDGYLTEVNFIDGQQLTPSSFGTTNAITGVWQPAKYTGTYGTNGFYLNFSDNSNNTATTIGKDYSGNGNNWTPNNISVTAGVTYDSMTDVPTLTSATAANYCVLNPLQLATPVVSYSLSNGNLQMNTNSGSTYNCFANGTIFVTSGKWYAEFQQTGGTRVFAGISRFTNIASPNSWNSSSTYYINTGEIQKDGSTFATGATWTTGDIIGVAYDADSATCAFYKNNSLQATVTGVTAGTYSFSVNGYQSGVIVANFGQQPFTYTPPTGFVALNTYNLPASTITNGAAYMAATTYSGNGGTLAVSNAVSGVSFQPDFVWIKSRSVAYNNYLEDSVRGAGKDLSSNATDAEATYSLLSSFNSNGFTAFTNGTYLASNQSGATYVGWQWKAGTTSASNTNGSITSTVSVGATQGFSVATYTGTGSTATVGHGLGVTPSMIIVKDRSAATNWAVYHTSLGANSVIFLNSTNASTTVSGKWGTPNSTTFGINTAGDLNASGESYVAYCFSAVAGYSSAFSYTGNGSTDGPFLYLGFRPRWIMIKRSSSTGSWEILDTSRNPYNDTNLTLEADLSAAESTGAGGNWGFDILSNGFKIRGINSEINTSGQTYIGFAVAENPFKLALAR